ncbi:MAG: cytochrome C, partial [Deltaproteobacteria bacterium]|nr:cytochrome C [Deltaproteobacteria bacterium]
KGRISRIRPQFIAYYSDLRGGAVPKIENRLLKAQWKAFFPHTVRTGTVMCDNCHDNGRRFLMEKEEERIYRIDLDGLGLSSFWNQSGQQVVNGSFVDLPRYSRIIAKSAAYTKAYVAKWKTLVERVDNSSKD